MTLYAGALRPDTPGVGIPARYPEGARRAVESLVEGLLECGSGLEALVVYGSNSSFGLVQLFFETFVEELVAACPVPERKGPVLAENFERELNESLATLFRA